MHIIKLPEDRPDLQLQWGGNRAKLWCYKQFGYQQNGSWSCEWEGDATVFRFEREQDALFFSLRWGN